MRIPWRPLFVFLSLACSIAWIGFPAAARAASRGDAFLGYSRLGKDAFFANAGGLNGWQGALQIKVKAFAGVEGGRGSVWAGCRSEHSSNNHLSSGSARHSRNCAGECLRTRSDRRRALHEPDGLLGRSDGVGIRRRCGSSRGAVLCLEVHGGLHGFADDFTRKSHARALQYGTRLSILRMQSLPFLDLK